MYARSLQQKTVRDFYALGAGLRADCGADCADTSVVRTPSRLELLYVRSQIAIAAKAFGLDAIDMVSEYHCMFELPLKSNIVGLCQLQRP